MSKKSDRPCNYFTLFAVMLKIGLFTFGGGYAMIALLENELIDKKGWLDKEEFLNMAAISESTPGPISVNSATYIGYRLGGVTGAFLATLGVVIPSFSIIYVIALFFDRFLSMEYVRYAFKGIQVCVIYLIGMAGVRLLKGIRRSRLNRLLILSVMICMIGSSVLAVNFSSIYYILICGGVGMTANWISSYKEKEDENS